jgi:predicted CoA-binding protein
VSKKVVVIGASEKSTRYSNMAVRSLSAYGYDVVAIGNKIGMVGSVPITKDRPSPENVFAVTLYLGARRQTEYFEYILQLKPQRLIFNPGAENPELASAAQKAGIEVINDCTLMMLGSGTFS